MDGTAEVLGERLWEFVQKADVKVADVAEVLGVTEDAIQKRYSGQGMKQWIKLLKVAKLLQVTPNQLLGAEEEALPPVQDREKQLRHLRALFEGLGLSEPLARYLAEIYLKSLETPLDPALAVSAEDQVRIAARSIRLQSEIEQLK